MKGFLRGACIFDRQYIITPFRSLNIFQSHFAMFHMKIFIFSSSGVMESKSKDIINNEKILEMKI
jgi:hypothetical protein